MLTDSDEDAMDQDSSDNSSDGLFSDSELAEEADIPTAEKFSLSIPSEVSIEKEITYIKWKGLKISSSQGTVLLRIMCYIGWRDKIVSLFY